MTCHGYAPTRFMANEYTEENTLPMATGSGYSDNTRDQPVTVLHAIKGTAMLIESVGWTATALVAGCLMCSGIMADREGECYERKSYNASRSIPYKETYYERCWLFFTCVRARTNYINETYEAFRLNRTCCGGYENKSGNCVAQYSRGCQNCQKPRTCGCSENPKKCVSVCETEYRISIFWSQCDDEHKFSADRTKCSPKCNPSCAENAWCQKPNTCVCMPRYVGNGTSCLPECKKGCANGRCVAPDECLCNDGWNGPSCDEPLACVVASLVPESHSDDTPASNLSFTMGTDDKTNYSEIARTVPACGINCPDELLMHAFHSTKSGANVTYHLIPYDDVRCNNTKSGRSFLARHSNVIAGVSLAGIAFLIVGITCTIMNARRGKEKSKNMSTDNIVQYTSNVYVTENLLYEACS
ncbi:protein draper-like [Diprion similis]|uniref:protein draper-like n=1 Tax=Diprion similis TaxID=362088 RepID=UPI001EF802A1|nr:protein draper-like [Diprion similis]